MNIIFLYILQFKKFVYGFAFSLKLSRRSSVLHRAVNHVFCTHKIVLITLTKLLLWRLHFSFDLASFCPVFWHRRGVFSVSAMPFQVNGKKKKK